MALIHEWQLKTAYEWSDIPVACDGHHLALPLSKTVVGIWGLDALNVQPVELVGHHREITALCLGHGASPKLLCSASEDYVIVWNIHQAWQCFKQGETIRGCIVGTAVGPPQSMAFSPDDKVLAVAVQNNVLILSAKKENLLATLEGHTSMVTCVEFCPHYRATVVSVSDDRTFKVWNVEELSLVYQSTIVSASPFIAMTMNPNKEQVAIGTTDGQLRVYDLSDGNGFRCLHHLDVAKVIGKLEREKEDAETKYNRRGPVTVSSRPSWQTERNPADKNTEDGDTERGCSILGLCYTHQGTLPPITADAPALVQRENTAVRDVLTSSCTLVVATSVGLLQLNAFTLDVCAFNSLTDPIPARNYAEAESISLPAIGSLHLAVANKQQVWCIVGSLFQNHLNIFRWKLADIFNPSSTAEVSKENLSENVAEVLKLSTDSAESLASQISILSSDPLAENSILRAELIPKKKEDVKKSTKGKLASPMSKKGQQPVTDQPLTFKPKVKSSGYSTAPRRAMFQPDTKVTKKKSPTQLPSQSLVHRLSEKVYPVDSPPPCHLVSTQNVADRPTAINCIAFSGGGQSVACGLGNRAIQEFRLPLSGKGNSYTGHNAPVHSVHYSHTDQRLVSSAEDRSARIWVKGQTEPILVIDRVDNNFTADSTATKNGNKENSSFPKDVRFAQFYYVDKFILLASGNTFYLYKYHLDPTKDEIKRYLSKSRYKLVQCFPVEQAQSITRLTAVNSFHSYVTMAAGSDRSLSVYDMNTGKVLRVMTDVHTKPCHVIALNEGSAGVSHAASVYDLFATAAMMDCIKLWDIRTNRCVRRYEGHQNRSYPCGLSLSPCSRFLATGAEDKSAYIYDLRSGTYLHKLTGHTDVVSDVTFHPLKPQLLTACLDGRVRLFTDKG